MSGTSVIKQLPPKDLRCELRNFIIAVNRPSSANQLELVRKGFSLLRDVPASKDAVLEYFGSIFDKSVAGYMSELENVSRNSNQVQPMQKEDLMLKELYNSLIAFASSTHWSLLLSKWSLDLLGTLSSKYSGRGRAPVNGMLADSLQQWMSCRGTYLLIKLSTRFTSDLIHSKYESAGFKTLLDKCVSYTPHFDWVVAHIGSCYPKIVLKTVLKWGLCDFVQNEVGAPRTSKFNSTLGILMHLAAIDPSEVKLAFLCFFKWSLVDDENNLDKAAVVPFLMQLASHSPVLLSVLSAGTLVCVTPDLFRELSRFSERWVKFAGGRQPLLDLVVNLILYTEDSAKYIMTLLLDSTQNPDKGVASIAHEILEILIYELDVSVRVNKAKIPLLDSIQKTFDWLLPYLVSENELGASNSVTIFSLIGNQQVLTNCVSYVLMRSTIDVRLGSLVILVHGFKASEVMSPAIVLSLNAYCCKGSASENLLWINLSKLLKWEAKRNLILLQIQEALWDNIIPIAELLTNTQDVQSAHSIAEVIKQVVLDSKKQFGIRLIMILVQAIVTYFYICLEHSEGKERRNGVQAIHSMLSKVSQCSQSARAMAIRELLESALFMVPSVLFGTVPEPTKRLVQPTSNLLMDNHKQGISMLLAQRHSSVFHAGVIGNGKRKITPTCPTPPEKVVENTYSLIMALKACCNNENPQGTLDAVIAMALLLVELISPDVMYNGLPWPEEEFCKVTVERDLYIRRFFDNMPLLWSILDYIAFHRPALCYCSVLLRALMATLLGQWTTLSQQSQQAGQSKPLISTTTKVLQVMALGQLLPPPLNVLSDVIEHLPPNQVVLVLRDCVWNYMRDHVPSPALFSRDSNGAMWRDPTTSKPAKQYIETLRLVMHRNISSLGSLYKTLFVPDVMDEDETE